MLDSTPNNTPVYYAPTQVQKTDEKALREVAERHNDIQGLQVNLFTKRFYKMSVLLSSA